MSRKKLGVFIGSVTQNFSSRVCHTISAKAEEYGYDVYYFTTFNSFGDNLLYGEGEQQIFSLADHTELDGIILAVDTLNISDGGVALVEHLKKRSCPIVSLRVHFDGVYNISVDENVSMERMIRHFVEVHEFRDICFMTGKMELEDARLRFACYKRIMAEYGIPVTDDMVFYGDYWNAKGKAAVISCPGAAIGIRRQLFVPMTIWHWLSAENWVSGEFVCRKIFAYPAMMM